METLKKAFSYTFHALVPACAENKGIQVGVPLNAGNITEVSPFVDVSLYIGKSIGAVILLRASTFHPHNIKHSIMGVETSCRRVICCILKVTHQL